MSKTQFIKKTNVELAIVLLFCHLQESLDTENNFMVSVDVSDMKKIAIIFYLNRKKKLLAVKFNDLKQVEILNWTLFLSFRFWEEKSEKEKADFHKNNSNSGSWKQIMKEDEKWCVHSESLT